MITKTILSVVFAPLFLLSCLTTTADTESPEVKEVKPVKVAGMDDQVDKLVARYIDRPILRWFIYEHLRYQDE